jgi:hypothetical protein
MLQSTRESAGAGIRSLLGWPFLFETLKQCVFFFFPVAGITDSARFIEQSLMIFHMCTSMYPSLPES